LNSFAAIFDDAPGIDNHGAFALNSVPLFFFVPDAVKVLLQHAGASVRESCTITAGSSAKNCVKLIGFGTTGPDPLNLIPGLPATPPLSRSCEIPWSLSLSLYDYPDVPSH
jgi:hypothetical protein